MPFSRILVEGVRWRALPGDFPAWQTVYTYFRNWRFDGTWLDIHDRLYRCTRIDQGRHPSPSEAVLDSQSVKSAAGVHAAVGVDVGKQHHWTQAIYHGGHVGISAASVGHRCQHTRTPRGL